MSQHTLNETLKDLIERLHSIGKENDAILIYLAQTAQPTLPPQYVVPLLQQMFCNLPNFLSKITPQQLTDIIKEPSADFTTLRLLLDLRVVQQILQQISQLQLLHLSNNTVPPGSIEFKISYLKKVQEVFQSWTHDTLRSYHKTMTETPLHLERQQLLQLEPHLSWDIIHLVIELIKLPLEELFSFQSWFSELPPAHLQILIALLAFESATLLAVKQKISISIPNPPLRNSLTNSSNSTSNTSHHGSKKRKAETEINYNAYNNNNHNASHHNQLYSANSSSSNMINLTGSGSNISNSMGTGNSLADDLIMISEGSSPFTTLDEIGYEVSGAGNNDPMMNGNNNNNSNHPMLSDDFSFVNFDLVDFSDPSSLISASTSVSTSSNLTSSSTYNPNQLNNNNNNMNNNNNTMMNSSSNNNNQNMNNSTNNINNTVGGSTSLPGSSSNLPKPNAPANLTASTPAAPLSHRNATPIAKKGVSAPPLITPIMSRPNLNASGTNNNNNNNNNLLYAKTEPASPATNLSSSSFMPQIPTSNPSLTSSSHASFTPRYSLRILRQPPSQTVYQRILKPFPSVLLSSFSSAGDSPGLFLEAEIIRSDVDQPIPSCLEGTRVVRISESMFAAYKRLKIQSTSQQQGTHFRLKFTLKRYSGGVFESFTPNVFVISNLIEVFSHTQYLNEKGTTAAINLPTIEEVLPATGAVGGGSRVVVLGQGFVNGNKLRVKFGKTEVPATWHEAGTLIVVTPRSEGKGRVEVSVTNDGVNYCPSNTFFGYE
eukprot:TRINITY_DN729_c0_g2_i1.p1 TRINITY_DN729_c0_g2~~TRINITY_DN729_c0_g2_i1.p1  ORF type:complete len:770 (-),score=235.30 TRINITY_DN729_c0_g2_i1:710-3019(-)